MFFFIFLEKKKKSSNAVGMVCVPAINNDSSQVRIDNRWVVCVCERERE